MQTGRERLRAWLTRSQMTQRQGAEQLGFTEVFLSQILSGIRRPALENAHAIERVTGISTESWLLSDVSNRDRETEPEPAKRKVAQR